MPSLRLKLNWTVDRIFSSRRGAVTLLVLSLLTGSLFGSTKQRVIIIAIDQSGSMKKSDPERLRVEAASMLATLAEPDDRVGLIGFGTDASWLQEPIEKKKFDPKELSKLGDSDAHTSFAPVLKLWSEFLAGQDNSYWESHEASLVLFTDGRSEPADGNPEADRSTSIQIAHNSAGRGKTFAIGLGRDLDSEFLDSLVNATNGTRWDAQDARDLPDAFLRIATRILSLPVYQRLTAGGQVRWNGHPEKASIVFLGTNASSFRALGDTQFESHHVVVKDLTPSLGQVDAEWSGSGDAFLCIRQPLRLEPDPPLPASLLTDSPSEISLRLTAEGQQVLGAYFLKNATTDLLFETHDHREVLSTSAAGGVYRVTLGIQQDGDYGVTARLHSSYGSVETYLGEVSVRSVPVKLPSQIDIRVFDPIPRRFFGTALRAYPLLPTGVVTLTFGSSSNFDLSPSSLTVTPKQSATLSILPTAKATSIETLRYEATWTDGTTTTTRHGTVSLLVRPMTVAEFMRAKWDWLTLAALLLLLLISAIYLFRGRPVTGTIIVFQGGSQVFRLDLPRQGKFRRLLIREDTGSTGLNGGCLTIHGDQDRELAEIHSARRGVRWGIYSRPQAARLYDARGPARSNAELRALRNPVFKTQDNSILIRFM